MDTALFNIESVTDVGESQRGRMMAKPSVLFIGGGNMASAMVGGLLRGGAAAASIAVVDPDVSQRRRISEAHGVSTLDRADSVIGTAEIIVWAVKPQLLCAVVVENPGSNPNALHISIASGIRLTDLSRWLSSQKLIRAMPNTAALVGAGVTGLLAGSGTDPADRQRAENLLQATGILFWVETDDEMDAVTAISGSGPAYVFHFLESYQLAAVALGFSPERARQIALEVTAGAIEQARCTSFSFEQLRHHVTSKGGTTEAAIGVLEAREVKAALRSALHAAADRSSVLARELGNGDVKAQLPVR